MRVLINAFSTLGQRTGIGHYTAELIRCLQAQTAPGEIGTFPQGWAERLGRTWAGAKPWLSRGERRAEPAPSEQRPAAFHPLRWFRQKTLVGLRRLGQAYLAAHLRRLMTRHGYTLYHETNGIPLPGDHLTVTTLHDLSPLVHPRWHPPSRVAYFEKNFIPALARSQHFLTDSEFIRQEVIHTLGLPPTKVSRVHLGVRPGLVPLPSETTAATLRRLHLPAQYFLHVGTIEPRKNLLMLLRAYCSLPATVREDCPLVLIGGWGWGCSDVADYLHAEGKQRGVIHVGYVADADLAAVYNGARALVFPSHYEGFGLPPLEMLACGGAVLASTAGALVETVGTQAHLLDPADEDGWRAALARLVQDDDWWRQLRRGATAAVRPFTWENCAAQTLQVYGKVSAGNTPDQEKQPRAA